MAQAIVVTLQIFGIGGIVNFIIQMMAVALLGAIAWVADKPVTGFGDISESDIDWLLNACIRHPWLPTVLILKMFILFPIEIASTLYQFYRQLKQWKAAE